MSRSGSFQPTAGRLLNVNLIGGPPHGFSLCDTASRDSIHASEDAAEVARMQANMRDYAETFRTFRWPAPAHFNFATDVVDRWAADPNALAMRWIGDGGERRLTFRHFAERSDRLANALEGLGLSPGDRVLVMLPRVVEWWESLLGLEKARLVAMPATTLLTPKDIDYRIEAAGASPVITDAANADKADPAPPPKG